MQKKENYKHVKYLWDDNVASKLSPVELLVYRSNLLGADQRITNTGGGNTSAKIMEKEPIGGHSVEVLWVKGSGGDLRTSKVENFASLYQDKLIDLQNVYDQFSEKGVKSSAEDRMVEMYSHCTFNLNTRAASIDTPLHSFIPYAHVDHMHPNAVIAVAAAKNSKELTYEIYGDEIVWVPWMRPGFELGLLLQKTIKENHQAKGILLAQHGIISWAESSKACYELSLDIIERAAEYIELKKVGRKPFGKKRYKNLTVCEQERCLQIVLPFLRGKISSEKRFIATVQTDENVMEFINSEKAPYLADLGTSCPDHFLRTKIKPLFIDWNPQEENVEILKEKVILGLAQYQKDYVEYYERCKREDSPNLRNPHPTVVLIPGIGMVAWGKNKSESRVTAEFYNCAINVMYGSQVLSEYIALDQQEAFDIEYWALEEAKLQRMPKEKEMARKVAVVIGAGSGIGKETAFKLSKEGAHVVCADIDGEQAQDTANELIEKVGHGIGVAGSGLSSSGPVMSCKVDITDRESIASMYANVVSAYGGLDHVILTAGIFVAPNKEGKIKDEQWGLTYAINVTGAYMIADEAKKVFEDQALKGTLVITTSVNAAVAKKGSLAYDTSKAAANHLVRELAVEMAPLVRVNGLAPATVVLGSKMFPRERVISSLTKYQIDYSEAENTEGLVDKLAQFYANRTLTKEPVSPEDQAEVAYLLSSNRFSKTTGQIVSVDGGLQEAFLR